MADIQLRFGKDMLVIGSPVQTQLANTGVCLGGWGEEDALQEGAADGVGSLDKLAGVTFPAAPDGSAFDVEMALLLEPEVFEDAFRLEKLAGAQCLVAPTANLTPARLAHTGMANAAEELARAALRVTAGHGPEHLLVELAPCGLPLDASSKASLLENRLQYERAARLFAGEAFDAFFLNGFTRIADLKCALMGIRKVSDAPILVSVDVDGDGMLRSIMPEMHPAPVRERLEEAVAVMAEYGANAAGFCTDAAPRTAAGLARRVADAASLPVMVQLFLRRDAAGSATDADGSAQQTDDLFDAALSLAAAGAQFLRVAGCATPACTGALAAAVSGLEVGGASADADGAAVLPGTAALTLEPAQLVKHLRRSVNDALGIGGAR